MEQFYANVNETGKIIGFYTDAIHTPEQIPETAIPVTEEQWRDAIANQGKYIIVNSELVLAPPPSDSSVLVETKKVKILELNKACDAEIDAGYLSSVNNHIYGLKIHDQINFLGAEKKFSLDPTLTVIRYKVEDLGYQVDHTKEEFFQVMVQCMTFVEVTIGKCNTLKENVINATTISEVNNIVW